MIKIKKGGIQVDATGVYVKAGGAWKQVATNGPTPTNFNSATGGVITEFYEGAKKYRVHTFETNGNFVVESASLPFTVLVVAGGGGGGSQNDGNTRCGAGGAGGVIEVSSTSLLTAGTYPVAVGEGGDAGYPKQPKQGGNSSIGTWTAIGGGYGGSSPSFGDPNGGDGGSGGGGVGGGGASGIGSGGKGTAGQGNDGGSGRDGVAQLNGAGGGGFAGGGTSDTGGPGLQTMITGKAMIVAAGGNALVAAKYGQGGVGGIGSQSAGQAGVVMVKYEIAPSSFNAATGGEISEYTLDGKRYRVHKFESNSQFTIADAVNPFRVLAIAGGGGGSGQNGNNAQGMVGGNGGAGGVLESTVTLEPKEYAVTVGDAGPGGNANGGGNGGNSTLGSVTAIGGGGGGGDNMGRNGRAGGSGGGGMSNFGNGPGPGGGGAGTPYQGHNGGTGGPQGGPGGEGGGAGFAEASTTFTNSPRQSNITGTVMNISPGVYGTGGAGRGWDAPGTSGQQGAVFVSYEVAPPSWNEATGGTVAEFDSAGRRFRTHTFEAPGKFTVKAAVKGKPFRVMAVGAGAGGGYGGAGGHGVLVDDGSIVLEEKAYDVLVGVGGFPYSAGDNHDAPGGDGGPSGISGVVTAAGGISRGAQTGAGATTDITGAVVQYGGAGGVCIINDLTKYPGSPNGGGATDQSGSFYGAGGGGVQLGTAGTGYQGRVIISYEISPASAVAEKVGVARVLKPTGTVVSLEVGSQDWLDNQPDDPWFYWAPAVEADGSKAVVGEIHWAGKRTYTVEEFDNPTDGLLEGENK